MKWSEVRKVYPNQFVKIRVLSSYVEGNQEVIEDMAVIKSISDDIAKKELLKSKGNEVVYHTTKENIILKIHEDVI